MEQLLGRVLRMPFAERRPTEALNHAYAFTTGQGFYDAANGLHDRLVAMGFDEQAAREAIVADRAAAAAVGLPDLEPGPAIPPIRTPAMLAEVAPALGLGDNSFRFEAGRYNPPRLYAGAWKPKHHFFPQVGHMNDEEVACAQAIDDLPGLKHWVRNIEKQPEAFWLPTSTDRFYPDFVAEMEDGRWLVIEYKGGHLADGHDTAEKTNIGLRWAEVSGGKGRFWMAKRSKAGDFRQRLATLAGG